MKKIRKNILKSFLFICFGLAVATIAFASVRAPFTPPDSPGRPEVVNIRKDGCGLKYLAPKNDGGSPILLYLIEKRGVGIFWNGKWESAGASQTLEFYVPNLIEGSEMEFRVIAVNKAGEGKPSLPSNSVIIRDPFMPK